MVRSLLIYLRLYHPDLVILDINMPVMNGIEAAKKAIAIFQFPILILSLAQRNGILYNLLETGVKGFVLKDADNEEFLTAIQKVLRGGTYFLPGTAAEYHKERIADQHRQTYPREREVLEFWQRKFKSGNIGYFKHQSANSRTSSDHYFLKKQDPVIL